MTPTDEQLIADTLKRCGLSPAANLRRIGIDRGFNTHIHRFQCGSQELVAKVGTNPDRFPHNTREIDAFVLLATPCMLPVPAHRAHLIDEANGWTVLIMDHIEAREPSSEEGIDLATLDQSIAAMTTCWNTTTGNAPELGRPLPQWGKGTRNSSHPHRRRVDRFRKRSSNYLQHFAGEAESKSPSLELVRWLDANLEACLDEAAGWPRRLIHGDLHPENLLLKNDQLTILDWQTASWGAPILDLMRLILDGIPTITISQLEERVRCLFELQNDPAPEPDIHRQSAIAAAITHAGFISGWGGRPLNTLGPREKQIIQRHASPEGAGRLVQHLLSRHW